MPIIHRSLIVPFPVSAMYQLVNDVENYPQFLPWCKKSAILSQNEDEIRASLTLAGGGMQKSFTTCNRLQRDKMIEIRLVNGPFRNLQGFWQFEQLPDETGTKISLDLEFEFSNKFFDLAFGPMFNQVANSLVDAFAKHAENIYGTK